jgi:YVTN family beta-propeller protein
MVSGGVAYAAGAGPVSGNVIKACYNKSKGGLALQTGKTCPSGTASLTWNQFSAITASAPLSVKLGTKGSAPNLSITGVLPIAHGGTGSSTGGYVDLTTDQSVGGTKLFTSTITADVSGSAARVVAGPQRAATLHWYDANEIGRFVATPVGLQGIAYDGVRLWAANSTDNTASVVNPQAGTVTTFSPQCGPSCRLWGMAYDGQSVWTTNTTGNTLIRLLQKPDGSYPKATVGTSPEGIAFDGIHLWVANTVSDTLSEVTDSASPTVVNTVSVGSNPDAIAFDGTRLWVTNSGDGTVSEVDPTAAAVVNTITVGAGPVGIAYDGIHMWVTNSSDNTLSEIDPLAATVVNTLPLGTSPAGITYDGIHVWVACVNDNTVKEIDIGQNPAIVRTVSVGASPDSIAFDGLNVWVTNHGASYMSEL